MENLSIEKFDPTVEELKKIAADARAVVVTDVNDKEQFEKVAETRKTLKAVRVRITHTGKALRESAIKFQKEVIAKEKELVAIIEPEEDRLSEIEKEIEQQQHIEAMKLLLPVRRNRLAAIKFEEPVSDEQLNAMGISDFEFFFTRAQQHVNDLTAAALAEKTAEVDAEKKRLDDEAKAREREEQARKDERERIEREQKAEADRKEREAKEKADKEAAEKAKAEADSLYKAWYTAMTASEPTATYHTAHAADGSIVLWKRVGTYKPQK